MDLSFINATKASEEGATINIHDPRVPRDPDSERDTRPFLPVDDKDATKGLVEIDVYGPDHPTVSRLMQPQRARYMQQALMSGTKKGVRMSAEDIALEEEENLNIAVAATYGWRGFTNNGEVFPYSPENARLLYTSNKDIMLQVLMKVRDTATFLTRSKRS